MKPIIGAGDWNPRYVSYAKSFGNTPAAQLAQDRTVYPGGIMTGFTLWIQRRWTEWVEEFKLKPNPGWKKRDVILTAQDQDAFTSWLQKQYGA
jgi:hypothetical protein